MAGVVRDFLEEPAVLACAVQTSIPRDLARRDGERRITPIMELAQTPSVRVVAVLLYGDAVAREDDRGAETLCAERLLLDRP